MLNKFNFICFFSFGILVSSFEKLNAQYLNYVDTTGDRYEITSSYLKTNAGYISCGTTYYNADPPNYRNLEVKLYDNNFSVLSTQRFGDTNSFYQPQALTKIGNSYYAAGFKMKDTLIIGTVHKIDITGNILAEYEIFTEFKQVRISHCFSKNSSLFIAGVRLDTSDNSSSFFLKTDTLLNIEWIKIFDESIYGEGVRLLDSIYENNFVLSIINQTGPTNTKAYIYKLDSAGNTIWNKIFGGNQYLHSLRCKQLPTGNYFCFGDKENPIDNVVNSWFLLLDSNGNTIYDTTMFFVPENNGAYLGSLIQDGIFIVGINTVAGGEHTYLTKFDFNGNLLWKREFAPRLTGSYLYSHFDLQNGFHTFAGWVYSDSGTNTNDEWFLIVDEFGCDVANCNLSIPELENDLFKMYPNPATDYFYVEFLNTYGMNATIEIYNSIGELIYSTTSKSNSQMVNAQKMKNGIYFVNVMEGESFYSQKLIISR